MRMVVCDSSAPHRTASAPTLNYTTTSASHARPPAESQRLASRCDNSIMSAANCHRNVQHLAAFSISGPQLLYRRPAVFERYKLATSRHQQNHNGWPTAVISAAKRYRNGSAVARPCCFSHQHSDAFFIDAEDGGPLDRVRACRRREENC